MAVMKSSILQKDKEKEAIYGTIFKVNRIFSMH